MRLELLQAPAEPVVTLTEAKSWLRVDHSDEDALVTSLIAAATQQLDGRDGVLGRALVPQSWRALMPCFPCGAIELPLPPTLEVLSVKYLDPAGAEQTLSSGNYRVIAGGASGARIVPAQIPSWPSTARALDAVRVEFRAGYGDDPVPEALRQAILMTVADWYDNRGSAVIGQTVAQMPLTAERLAAPYRVFQSFEN